MVTGDAGIAHGKQNIFYEMLAEFSKHFKHVHVLTMANGKGKPFEIHENVTVWPSPRSRVLRWDFWSHAQWVAGFAEKADLVISHIIPPYFAGTRGAERLAAKLGVPHFAEFMHLVGHPKAASVREWVEKLSTRVFLRRHVEQWDALRIINEAEVRPVFEGWGISGKKIVFIPAFYVDFEVFKPRVCERNLRQFVYAGRFASNKNLVELLKAVEMVPDCTLKVVGDGEEFEKVTGLVKAMGLEDRVELLGWLPTMRDVASLYQESLALIMPSLSEGGPRVTLEAMACETPVLSTNVGIMKEVLKDGKNGLQIGFEAREIAPVMQLALENPEMALELGRAGAKDVQRFEYGKALRHYAKAYLDRL